MNDEIKTLLWLLRRAANELDGWATALPDRAGETPKLINEIEQLFRDKYPEHDTPPQTLPSA